MRNSSPRDTGTILFLALVISVMITLAVAAALSTAISAGKHSLFGLNRTDSLALAEGVTESVQKSMLETVANFETFSTGGYATIGSGSYPFSITAVGEALNRTDPDGVTMAIQAYQVSSTASIDTGQATVNRIVELTMTPIFQFMIFYSDDLELLPGPSMTLEGRVHSNGDLYVGSGHTLTVDTDYFRSTGEILRERKNNGSSTTGTIDIKVHEQSTFVEMTPNMDSSNSDWLNISNSSWQGTVQSAAHGVSEIVAPRIGTIKAFDPDTGERSYYHQNAALVLIDDNAVDGDGNVITLPAGTVTEKTMYDGRESKYVIVTEINIEKLNASGFFPDNGLIYAYRTDADADQPNGIRLTSGAELAAPLTIVSEDPLYIHGDFNTINKKGAAVISDAVNLLSNNWDNTKTPGNLPWAEDTQYNVAMVTGNVPTPDDGGNYSGGFENLPRFHERWSRVKCTIRGSFIKIYESEIGKSPWSYGGDVYKAPIRDWRFDPQLEDIANLPPFTPNAVYFRRVLWDDGIPLPF